MDVLYTSEHDAIISAPARRGRTLTSDRMGLLRTGGNYTDDVSDVSDSTYRPKVVHLGQYVSHGNGSVVFHSWTAP
jgi:hypothetical protein